MCKRSLWALWTCLYFSVLPAFAQLETARITGTVTDSSGAVSPGAQITMTHLQTERKLLAVTNDQGRYVSVPLPIGDYQVEVELAGFKRVARGGIKLQVQQTVVVDFTLEVGELTQRIDVTDAPPLLNTTEATQSQVIDNRKIVDLPLNGRDYVQLALLSAGAAQPLAGGRHGGFSAGGQRITQNNFLLDGVDNNNYQNLGASGERAEAVKPNIDAIQEFKVLTNSFSAEYGRAGGGVVNLVMKSGSNKLHGSVFGFLRNQVFDARNFFQPPNTRKPPFKRSQFGFALGGPIVKNKTFFFGDYEGTRIRESRTVNNTVPTPALRNGDFSALGVTIFDPLSYEPVSRTRQPFPNNTIPGNRIDPVARAAVAWYPNPQNNSLTNNFLFNPRDNQDVDKFDIKIDHTFNTADNIYYRFSYHHNTRTPSNNLPPPAFGGAFPTGFERKDDGINMALVWNHLFSPTFFTSTRLAWSRFVDNQLPPTNTNANVEIGLKGADQSQPGAPQFQLGSGFTSLGLGGFFPTINDSQVRQLVSDTTKIQGDHNIKFGANFMWLQANGFSAETNQGIFLFDGRYTSDPVTFAGGNSLADFLLGFPNSARLSTAYSFSLRAPWYNFYVSDEWQAAPKLKLTLGLRYELRQAAVDSQNRLANFDMDTDPANPRFVLAKEGSRLDRAVGVDLPNTNFGPRFGFAYQALSHTVLRGGYGIYYGNWEHPVGPELINPPFTNAGRLDAGNITPAFVLRDGVPPGVLRPEGGAAGGLRLSPRSISVSAQTPINQQWNFNIQHQFGGHWLWEVGYYGTRTQHLQTEHDGNFALPGTTGSVDERRRVRSAIYPGTNIVFPLSRVTREDYDGNSVFHSLQTRIEKQFSAGFSLLGAYMWSKTIGDGWGLSASGSGPGNFEYQNPLDRDRGLDENHLAHRFVVSPIWELPFGHGGRMGAKWNGLTNAFLGGWSVASIITITSGRPFTVVVPVDRAGTARPNYPDLVGNARLARGERTIDRWFNTAAFVPNQPGRFGNAGRNILTAPGLENVDFAAYKRFEITEGKSLQFRFEAFNFFNTPSFGYPGNQLGTPNFARITSVGRPRNIQFGLKFVF